MQQNFLNLEHLLLSFFPDEQYQFSVLMEEMKKDMKKRAIGGGFPITNKGINTQEKYFILQMAVTGFNEEIVKKGISFDTTTNTLKIEIKKEETDKLNNIEFYQRNIAQRDIKANYQIPQNIELEKIEIEVQYGILTIKMFEKKKEIQPISLIFKENEAKQITNDKEEGK